MSGVTTFPTIRLWPWAVYGAAMAAMAAIDVLVVWQWRSAQPYTYSYWLESTAGAASYGAVGALIASRVPGNRLGPLMLVVAVASALEGLGGVLGQAGASHGWPISLLAVLGGVFTSSQTSVVGFVALMLFLAPDGRPWNRLWRACAWVVAVTATVAAVVGFFSGPDPGTPGRPETDALPGFPAGLVVLPGLRDVAFAISHAGLAIAASMIVLAMAALVQRWWQSPPDVRQQVTWPIVGALATPLVIVIMIPVPYPTLYRGDPVWALAACMIPLGIAIGVFRRGLYGLDRVVSRTVSYAIVTGVVLGVYVVVVTVATRALPVTNDLAVAAGTLAAAAAAGPVLRRVRRAVDRRFDRQQVDAERAVDAFGRGLVDQFDAAQARLDLVQTTERLLAPSSVALWTAER